MSFADSSTAAGAHIPAKRNRTPKTASDSDSADERPFTTFRRDEDTGLQTPPPSSPTRPFPTTTESPSGSTTSIHPPAVSPPIGLAPGPQLRVIYLRNIRERYPDLDVSNFSDFDILTLAGIPYNGTLNSIHEWLAHKFRVAAEFVGSTERITATSKDTLDMIADFTGLKPEQNDPGVKLCAIAGSDYLMRLWPGSTEAREWCLDFIHSATREPVNSPFTFKLWIVPPSTVGYSSGPWQPAEAHRVYSLENRFGIRTKDITRGAEKFVLNDGQSYMFWRPAPYQSVQFTVPSRPLPVTVSNPNLVPVVSFE